MSAAPWHPSSEHLLHCTVDMHQCADAQQYTHCGVSVVCQLALTCHCVAALLAHCDDGRGAANMQWCGDTARTLSQPVMFCLTAARRSDTRVQIPVRCRITFPLLDQGSGCSSWHRRHAPVFLTFTFQRVAPSSPSVHGKVHLYEPIPQGLKSNCTPHDIFRAAGGTTLSVPSRILHLPLCPHLQPLHCSPLVILPPRGR